MALRSFGPLVLAGLRFAVAGLVLAPVAVPVLRRLGRRDVLRIGQIAAIGLWGQMVMIYLGIDEANGAIAAIIVGLEPVLIAAWAAVLLHERFSRRAALGLSVGLLGSLLVAGVGRSGGTSLAGLAFLLATGVLFSWYTVRSKSFLDRCTPLELTAAVSVLGAAWGLVPMIVAAAVQGSVANAGPQAWLMVLYLAIGNSVIGYVLWNRALHRLPARAVGASLYAQPILGAGLSWVLLRDPLPTTFVAGTALVLVGVYLASSRSPAPAAAPEPPA